MSVYGLYRYYKNNTKSKIIDPIHFFIIKRLILRLKRSPCKLDRQVGLVGGLKAVERRLRAIKNC